jgi:DNA polymerase-3 subunit gamma/tau
MASQSLYRKWRSQSFSDLVGQEPIVRTLCHAVRDGRLAHAYLFCGPRGTGKTSVARLLAKAVNCANPHDGEPCNVCTSCREITDGRSPDVIEIDAASNNSVENIRDLRSNVNVLGIGGRYKVYVIDEAHMLSASAFNALLKTLEEPPPHVIFVLATTEAHKILPTIVSRCQRFNFRRIGRRDTVARIQHVAAGEGLTIEPAAVELLAQAAQGGLRDALSLLDQAMAFCGTEITLASVRGMLGLADAGAVRALVECVAQDRAADGLGLINELVEAGADLRQLTVQLGELWRALVLARAGADLARILDCGPDEARDLAALASQFSLDELTACAGVFATGETQPRGLPVPQLGLELAFLQCVRMRHGQPAAGAAPAMSVRTAPAASQPPSASAPAAGTAPRPLARPEALPAVPPSAPLEPQVEELDLDALADDAPVPAVTRRAAAPVAPPPSTPSLPPTPSPRGSSQETPPPAPAALGDGPNVPGAEGHSPTSPAAEPAAASGEDGDWLVRVQSQWELIKKVCKQRKRTVAALLQAAHPIMASSGDTLEVVLQAEYQFHLEKLREAASRADVEWAMQQVLERPCHVRLVLAGSGGSDGAPRGGRGPAGRPPTPGGNGNGHAPHQAGPPTNGQAHTSSGSVGQPYGVASVAAEAVAASQSAITSARQIVAPLESLPAADTLEVDSAPRIARPDVLPPTQLRAAGDALEDEARADPVIREIMRTYPAELVEVRPIPRDQGH